MSTARNDLAASVVHSCFNLKHTLNEMNSVQANVSAIVEGAKIASKSLGNEPQSRYVFMQADNVRGITIVSPLAMSQS